MGDAPVRRPRRVSRTVVRAWAWVMGALSFLTPWALLGFSPVPAQAAPAAPRPVAGRPVVVVVTKRVVVSRAASSSVTSSGPVHYTYAPSTGSAAATTCGTHPC
jgi:hypothetical protein